nr:hypothetical protein HK105_008012 [Polyrhizophydium stewartii]
MAGQLADDNDDTEFEKHQQRELEYALMVDVEMRLAGDDPAAAKLVADIHAHITPSGAIGGEEILDRLLLEARRIQWERAAAAAAADGRPDAAAAPPPPRSADAAAASRRPGIVAKERGAKSSNRPLSQRERDLLAGVYRQINDSGAADAEGILDVLLSEALRIVERRTLALQAKL